MSSRKFNELLGLALCVPITSKVKGYPFEVSLNGVPNITGVVLCEQIRCIAWEERGASRITTVPKEILIEVVEKISVLFPSED